MNAAGAEEVMGWRGGMGAQGCRGRSAPARMEPEGVFVPPTTPTLSSAGSVFNGRSFARAAAPASLPRSTDPEAGSVARFRKSVPPARYHYVVNTELETRWRQGLRPFDGPVLVADDTLTEEALLAAVQSSLVLLRERYAASALYLNEDWHEHDGFISPATSTSWDEAISWSQDRQRLRASCPSDWLVHALLFPDNFAFCLRYWSGWELGDDGFSFDLCAEREILEQLVGAKLVDKGPFSCEPSAKEYFDRIWAG